MVGNSTVICQDRLGTNGRGRVERGSSHTGHWGERLLRSLHRQTYVTRLMQQLVGAVCWLGNPCEGAHTVWKIERISLLRQRLFPCCACPEPVLVKQSSFFNIEMAAEKGVVSRTVQVDQAEHSCAAKENSAHRFWVQLLSVPCVCPEPVLAK
jgi:hypothetical protein